MEGITLPTSEADIWSSRPCGVGQTGTGINGTEERTQE